MARRNPRDLQSSTGCFSIVLPPKQDEWDLYSSLFSTLWSVVNLVLTTSHFSKQWFKSCPILIVQRYKFKAEFDIISTNKMIVITSDLEPIIATTMLPHLLLISVYWWLRLLMTFHLNSPNNIFYMRVNH